MKKGILLILFVFLLFISLLEISCQKEEEKWMGTIDEVDELIEENINARGGYEKLKAIKSLKITAKYVQQGRETPIILTIKRPNFVHAEILFPASPMICGFDGKTAWWFNRARLSEPQILPAEEALIFTRYADFGDLFVDYEEKGQKIELIGIEDIDDQKVYKLRIISQNDIIRYVYLDAKNFLKIRESYKNKKKKESGLEVIFKDFREVNGIVFPFYHDITAEQTSIERIEMNVDIDDSFFKMPLKISNKDQLNVSEFVQELDSYLKTTTEKDLFSGVVLVANKGKPFFKKAYGMADRERNILNQVNTKFCVGSINKMFTAVAIAQIVEQGKLSYDDLIRKHLGAEWILSEVGKKVKISHLLTHTSGIAEYLTDELLNSSAEIYRTLEDHKPIVRDKSLTFKPGTRWEYCNTGFILLGAIIEKMTGEDYSDYIKKHIYNPADMDNTIYFDLNKTVPNLAMGYEKVKKDGKSCWRKTPFAGKIDGSPSGGGFSTVEDLLKFAVALRSNKLISRKSRDLLFSVKARSSSIEYGYGFLINSSVKLGQIVGHGGAAPGVSANFRMFVDKEYTMIILSNYSEACLAVSSKIKSLLPLK